MIRRRKNIGASATVAFDNTLITLASGSTNLVYNKDNPAQGEVSIVGGTVTQMGELLAYQFHVKFDEDDEFVLEFDSSLIPNEIIGLAAVVDNAGIDQIGLACPSDRQIRFNRLDSIDVDLNARVLVWAR